jgi:hypothetical protein
MTAVSTVAAVVVANAAIIALHQRGDIPEWAAMLIAAIAGIAAIAAVAVCIWIIRKS